MKRNILNIITITIMFMATISAHAGWKYKGTTYNEDTGAGVRWQGWPSTWTEFLEKYPPVIIKNEQTGSTRVPVCYIVGAYPNNLKPVEDVLDYYFPSGHIRSRLEAELKDDNGEWLIDGFLVSDKLEFDIKYLGNPNSDDWYQFWTTDRGTPGNIKEKGVSMLRHEYAPMTLKDRVPFIYRKDSMYDGLEGVYTLVFKTIEKKDVEDFKLAKPKPGNKNYQCDDKGNCNLSGDLDPLPLLYEIIMTRSCEEHKLNW